MQQRDRRDRAVRSRLPAALQDMYENAEKGGGMDDEDDEEAEERRRRRRMEEAADGLDETSFDTGMFSGLPTQEDEPYDLTGVQGFVKDWILLDAPRREVKRLFRKFLHEYNDERLQLVYKDRIQQMCAANQQSLKVNYKHLAKSNPRVAIWLADAPRQVISLFDEVALEEVLKQFPNYEDTHRTIHVRITDLPICDAIRSLRQIHTNALVRIAGTVTRRTGVFPQLSLSKYNCAKCGEIIGPFAYSEESPEEVKIGSCPGCQSKGPFSVNQEQTVYRNYQKISLQESPGKVPAGRVPRHKTVILTNDLIDSAKPGDEIEVTGTYVNNFDVGLNVRQGFPVFSTLLEANYVLKKDNKDVGVMLSDEDRKEIHDLSRDPRIAERIFKSIAPSIYGQNIVKTAVAISLFGGREKNVNNKHRIRGDINVLLLGDPGTAKSQILKYIEKTAPRAVYTTGKGASAVGLTAAVHKDPLTKEWTLEGGALVLADRGVCMIDEFDKMNDADRTSIHEAMEQQSISISKAGIVTTLQARCAVIAAANPIGGRYDASRTLAENVELTDPILQRFDILCVVRDRVDPIADERLARFVTGSHMASVPITSLNEDEQEDEEEEEEVEEEGQESSKTNDDDNDDNSDELKIIPQALLKKYIWFARSQCRPSLHDVNKDKIVALYSELRQQSASSGGVPIAVRHIESIIRISEAHARMHLRDHVRDDDVNVAIRVMLESFISAQKHAIMKPMRRKFRRYLDFQRGTNTLLMHIVEEMVRTCMIQQRQLDEDAADFMPLDKIRVSLEDFKERAKELQVYGSGVEDFFRCNDFKRSFKVLRSEKVIEKLF